MRKLGEINRGADLAALPEEVKATMTDALTLIAERTFTEGGEKKMRKISGGGTWKFCVDEMERQFSPLKKPRIPHLALGRRRASLWL